MSAATAGTATRILDGRAAATALRARTAEEAAALTARGTTPHLAVVSATDDGGSAWYVRSIARAATATGLGCSVVDLGAGAGVDEVRDRLAALGEDPGVHGIILQTPLPEGPGAEDLAGAVPVGKDVDGANPLSAGRLAAGLPAFAPATAASVLALLDHHEVPLRGRHVVVVGRSTVVGRPVAQLALHRDATVTLAHSRTADLPAVTRTADVLVVAVGRAGLVGAEHVGPTQVVVDVGTNPTAEGGLTGDVDAVAVEGRVGALSPVPGGVGPLTTALLLAHTVQAARAG